MTTSTSTKLVPLGDRVVVKLVEREEVTSSGLVLPDTAKEKPQEGQILAVAPGRMTVDGKWMPLDFKEVERIIFAKYAGTEVKLDGEEYLILREPDILAKLG